MPATAFVFDAYGTLFDVHAAIARHRNEIGPDADRLSELWRAKQLEYSWTLTLADRYLDFWSLTQQALDHAFARVPSADRRLRGKLLEAYRQLDAFADARATLKELKRRGHRTAILSNGSPDMLKAAVAAAGLGTDLDFVLSVDSIRKYKPRPEVGRRVRVLEPVGRDGRGFVRLPGGLDQSRQPAGRICRPAARSGAERSHRVADDRPRSMTARASPTLPPAPQGCAPSSACPCGTT